MFKGPFTAAFLWVDKKLAGRQRVEAVFVYGGNAELQNQFINVKSVDRKVKC